MTTAPNYKEICKTIKIDDSRLIEVKLLKEKFLKNIERYRKVSALCLSFPVDLLFALHYRESDCNFKTCLHNGDDLPGPTRHEPKGRGPFSSWEEAAVDALLMKKNIFPTEWTFESRLEFAEKYNGTGYRTKVGDSGVIELSPYVFAGTNFSDETGKYVFDGHYDPKAPEKQLGVAPILIELNRVQSLCLTYLTDDNGDLIEEHLSIRGFSREDSMLLENVNEIFLCILIGFAFLMLTFDNEG